MWQHGYKGGVVDLVEIIGRAQQTDLGSLPHVVRGVFLAAQAPETSLKTLEQLVALDPPLAARILRAVNAPYYGTRHSVDNLGQAVVLLGLKRVLDIALQQKVAALLSAADGKNRSFLAGIWWYSVGVGDLSRNLYRHFFRSSGQGIYVAGLLHRLGILVLLTCLGDTYQDLLQVALQTSGSLASLEYLHVGFSHQELMERLALDWQFPNVLGQTLRYYHHPQEAPEDCSRGARVLFLASQLMLEHPRAKPLNCLGTDGDSGDLSWVLDQCGWTRQQLQVLLTEVWSSLDEMDAAGLWDLGGS